MAKNSESVAEYCLPIRTPWPRKQRETMAPLSIVVPEHTMLSVNSTPWPISIGLSGVLFSETLLRRAAPSTRAAGPMPPGGRM